MLTKASAPKILVVDDDTSIRITLNQALTKAGMNVRAEKNGAEGYKAFCEEAPDLVVSDIQMPEMNGYELSSAIRSSDHGALTPFLMMTGTEGQESIELSYDAGATDFISKPINYPLLVNRVRYILRAHSTFLEWTKSQNQLENLGRVLDNSSNEIFFINAESGLINSANKAALRNLGYTLSELKNFTLASLLVDSTREKGNFTQACQNLRAGSSLKQHFTITLRRQDSSTYPVEGDMYSSQELPEISLVCIFEDITERLFNERRMRHLAYYDSLTNLPNRELFFQNFKNALLQAERYGNMVGLLFVDLDNFKHVNDMLGHKAGDELLGKIADVLRSCIRNSDYIGTHMEGSLARFGGDEFAVLLSRLNSTEEAGQVADRILEAVSRPNIIREREILITPSIGIVVSPEHGSDPDTLLQRADVAMYAAKKSGKKNYQYYCRKMHSDGLYRMELERDLKLAIKKGEFKVNYQPKFDIETGMLSGFEALLRWSRNDIGVSPEIFIPLAEESNLILDIGNWVIDEVCRQIKEWHDAGVSKALHVAVNFSARQFSDPGLVDYIRACFNKYEISASCFQVELTESAFMSSTSLISEILVELSNLGCSIALDDFGTGYSSLSYLNRFPLDVLKIDKSFVSKINTDNNNSIVAAIVALSYELDLQVVAEGVETEEQLSFLRELKVKYLQGYLWGAAAIPEDLEPLLASHSQKVMEAHSPVSLSM